MTKPPPATPLVSLPAVVFDSETTGLDMKVARVVQMAGLKVTGCTCLHDETFETLINPGSPIPPESTRIHGIADADVAGAPSAGDALSGLEAFLTGSVLVGHTISYDLGILKREAEIAGLPWRPPRALDVKFLARIAAPSLGKYGLDELCSWLGVEIEGRHTAMGDAVATAEVFTRLVPKLREKGIRTLAEAEAASRRMMEQEAVEAGVLMTGVRPAGESAEDKALGRVDTFPYRRRIKDVMSSPPAILPGEMTLKDALKAFIGRGVSSVFVPDADGKPGIVTERDVLRAIHGRGPAALDAPLTEFRNAPLEAVSQDAFVYRAIGRMDRLGVRHLGVTDQAGNLVGAVTTRNLLRHRASAAMLVGDGIRTAEDEAGLGRAWAELPQMARRLEEEEVDPRTVANVISSEICNLTRRAAEIGEERMKAAGKGGPPVAYAVLVLGSAGRGESLLAADQDNAIVFEKGEDGGPEDLWFEEMAGHMADILDGVGVPYCNGGVMAKNKVWRRTLEDWKRTVDLWVSRQKPEDLLNVDIFFDSVPVHGDLALGDAAWSYAYEQGAKVSTFWRALSETLAGKRPPLTMFGNFQVEASGRVDLKKGGIMPIFTAARILSLKGGVKERATPARLEGAAAAGIASVAEIERLIEAHRTILGVILAQQIIDAEAGVPLSPKVDAQRLSKADRSLLKAAVEEVSTAVDLAREGVF